MIWLFVTLYVLMIPVCFAGGVWQASKIMMFGNHKLYGKHNFPIGLWTFLSLAWPSTFLIWAEIFWKWLPKPKIINPIRIYSDWLWDKISPENQDSEISPKNRG